MRAPPSPQPDIATACRFLARFGAHLRRDGFTFQTFDDGPTKRKNLARILHGSLESCASRLISLNAQGAGVFFMVNAGNGHGRTEANVIGVRALFVDLDGAPLALVESAPLRPHILVESSPNRWHAYWLVSDLPREQFKALQHALAERFGGDPKVCDLPRVMRLPGFLHKKAEPHLSKLIDEYDGPPYLLAEIVDELSLAPVSKARSDPQRALSDIIPEGARNATLFDLGLGLARQGQSQHGIKRRLRTLNAGRCAPPLPTQEVDAIASSAARHESSGFSTIPHRMQDAPKWKALAPSAKQVVYGAFRRYNGHNNGRIVLAWEDFDEESGFSRSATFYKHRRAAVDAGFLIETVKGKCTQTGKLPAYFAIPEEFLHRPPESANAAKGRLRNKRQGTNPLLAQTE